MILQAFDLVPALEIISWEGVIEEAFGMVPPLKIINPSMNDSGGRETKPNASKILLKMILKGGRGVQVKGLQYHLSLVGLK